MALQQFVQNWEKEISQWMKTSKVDPKWLVTKNSANVFQNNFMPEPYLGDPDKHSFVIINLNPGGGLLHSWNPCKNIQGTLINRVKNNSYEHAVKSFPYLCDEKQTGYRDWNDYGARKWWMQKKDWIDYITSNGNMRKALKEFPFAIELFPWHSSGWDNRIVSEMKPGGALATETQKVVDAVRDAINNSTIKFAYSVGKDIGNIFYDYGFCICTTHTVIKNGRTRHYRVLKDKNNHILINTWAQGGNKYPAKDFWQEEIKILRKLNILP